MKYTKTSPCKDCPFLKKHKRAFSMSRLREFTVGEFVCHKTGYVPDDYDGLGDEESAGYRELPNGKSEHCAGALIFLEKRGESHQMMRIAERLGMYDHTKLDMTAPVR